MAHTRQCWNHVSTAPLNTYILVRVEPTRFGEFALGWEVAELEDRGIWRSFRGYNLLSEGFKVTGWVKLPSLSACICPPEG